MDGPEQAVPAAGTAGALRIGLLTHSTNPRGGVVHALEVGSALHDAGHRVTVFAPDERGRGFFRAARCASVGIPARAVSGDLTALVRQRIQDYVEYLSDRGTRSWDVLHAQDGISANALALLQARGQIAGFVRTVHHLEDFSEPQLAAWQMSGFREASRVICVSGLWRDLLAARYGVRAEVIQNGVDRARYGDRPDAGDARVADRYGIAPRGAPVLLAVGGIEARKNTRRVLEAFLRVRASMPRAQLVIAGGASLLDHRGYRGAFEALLSSSGLSTGCGRSVVVTGVVPDEDMPALFRAADALVFPSLNEGFGLVALEAMACGTPVVVSRMAPFTEYLAEGDCAWCDPLDSGSIADAIRRACNPATSVALRRAGHTVSARFPWAEAARRHLEVYRGWVSSKAAVERSHA